ncbi:MAG TPA: argininosuccinate lyase [Aggregatilineales bacterium]|nr:argininosuccinate lyase [Aggregatilineales bacterium]
MALWGGRFSSEPDEAMRLLNDSLPFDKRMYKQDIQGSIAYTYALHEAGIITAEEAEILRNGLQAVLAEMESGGFEFLPTDEDIHTAVERRLTEIAGVLGGKLHTGRSRNDQVATDFRLWARYANQALQPALVSLARALVIQAKAHAHTIMPGYTHVQPGQPTTAGHWLLSYFEMIKRDIARLVTLDETTLGMIALGSGALAGTPLQYDRTELAKKLDGYPSHNSLDAVADRDFVAEMLFICAMIGVHLSRLGEDIVLYSNPNFGYITLNDRYSTGSSLMPQKRNADPMELARGKAGRLIGNLTGFLTTLKGLPSTYNKDLQEDKEALFDSFDSLMVILPVVTAIIETLKLNPDKMRAALTEDMLATDMADYLVAKGMPFREAHHIVGQVVRIASEHGIGLTKVPLDELKALSTLFDVDVAEWLTFEKSVSRRSNFGGTAPDAVLKQIEIAESWMESKAWVLNKP